ncbi:hypothetical protein L3i22_077810 [Actinoplanes sp. L3-i22]|nr:hypothetical protein L3i22_077810 [Actinoplanes sp. L3-i22]
MGPEFGLFRGLPDRLRGRNPRLSGTLRIRDALGHDVTIPLRGRAAVLTTGGTGLAGHGEVWAVHTDPDATVISLMISYGRTPSPADRKSGLCPPGATITLAGAIFTWHCPAVTPRATPATVEVPRPRAGESTADQSRAPGNTAPSASRDTGPIRNSRAPLPRSANARPTASGLRQRVQAIVRDLTHPPRP